MNFIQRYFVNREERSKLPPTYKDHEHHYRCVGGSGDWEMWECKLCFRSTIPSVFGCMWPNLRILQWINPTLKCYRRADD